MPFTIMCDESTDYGQDKCMVILVRLFDNELHMPLTRFLDMPIVNIGTAVNLFHALDQTLTKHEIPWSNVFAFMSGNCSVMKGKHNSVISRIRERQPLVMDMGCICHLANLCVGAAVKLIPLSVEDLILDIYCHFNQSSKRKEEYKAFLEFQDIDPLKIIKHVSTRWLSLKKCVDRTLHHWPALLWYFNSHKDVEKKGRIKRVAKLLDTPEMKMYFLFLNDVLEPMNDFNTAFQADASKIGLLHDQVKRLLRIFLKRFVKTSVIVAHTDVTQVPYDVGDNFLPNDKLVVGLPCRGYIADHQDEIGVETEKKLYRTVRNFYIKIVSKMVDKFPFSDTTLQDIAFINPRMKTKIVSDSVTKLANRFPQAIGCENTSELLDQFTEHQLLSPDDLPTFDQDISSFWGEMAEVDDIFNDKKHFNTLSKLAKAFLVLPNSNADCERAFSIIKKIYTEFRSELNNDTLCALLSCKFNETDSCYKYQPSCDVLKAAKTGHH